MIKAIENRQRSTVLALFERTLHYILYVFGIESDSPFFYVKKVERWLLFL